MADHDSLYHRLFRHKQMVESLIRDFVPEALSLDLDFGAMAPVSPKFHDGAGRRRVGDVIWRLPTFSGAPIYLYMLLEFQSRADPLMAQRMHEYIGLLWGEIVRTEKPAGPRLPPVLPLVLYNGVRPWRAATDTRALIDLPADSPLWRLQPQNRYHVIDLARLPGDALARRRTATTLLARLERPHAPVELAGLIDEVVGWFRAHPDYGEVQADFQALVHRAVQDVDPTLTIPSDMEGVRGMLLEIGDIWRKQWREEGLAEGRQQGLLEGREKGLLEGRQEGEVLALIRVAEARFGPLAAEDRARIEAADPATLDVWLDQVGRVDSLAALFGTRH